MRLDVHFAPEADRRILVGGSSTGVSVAACKNRPIRLTTICIAHQAIARDGVRVLCLGARVVGAERATELVSAFVAARQNDVERQVPRHSEVAEIEQTRVESAR